ncbi:hypothetical protein [Bradyrhizobium cosmicum]|uniref:hypothetical protein n=1 Tax=Bradyrhizobium cosmicum TaxID=1404864 RepID=UPI0028EA7C66|nr:hypothetical protein [Bradyrhizobium cosmicum]
MRHLPENAREIAGSLHLGDTDLQELSPQELTKIRGRRLGMVFGSVDRAQPDAHRQVTETLIQHRGLSQREANALAIDLLGHVELRDPAAIMRRYPPH